MTDDVVTEIPFGESGKTDEGSFGGCIAASIRCCSSGDGLKAKQSHGMTETDFTVSADGSRRLYRRDGVI